MALIALAIVLDSPGSPFFVQERIGFRGKRFKVYKFRSMWREHDPLQDCAFMQSYVSGQVNQPGADSQARVAAFKPIRRESVTRVGHILRKTSLDELPQIINVLRGEMSLIGPRPNVPWEVQAYRPWHYERLETLPGITGLAQVMGRSDITFNQIARYDILYIKNQCLQLDWWIVAQTVRVVLTGKGAG